MKPQDASPVSEIETASGETAMLFFESDMDSAVSYPLAPGQSAVYTHRSPIKDTANEDSVLLLPVDGERAVIAVADGLGGLPGGETASAVALTSLAAAILEGVSRGRELRDCILNGIEAANTDVMGLGTGSATTLAVVEVSRGHMRSYHVGDSSICVVGGRGKLKQVTTAHSPIGYALESGFLPEDEALLHEERHIVSNILGDPEMKIEIGPVRPMASRDTLVVASDGLMDNLRVEEILAASHRGSVLQATQRLVDICRDRMLNKEADQPHKPDDLTLVLFRRRRAAAS